MVMGDFDKRGASELRTTMDFGRHDLWMRRKEGIELIDGRPACSPQFDSNSPSLSCLEDSSPL